MTREGPTRRKVGLLLAGLAALPVPGAALTAALAASRRPLPHMRARLVRFASAPFPYYGRVPTTGEPFLDTVASGGQRGHLSPRGGLYLENPTYSDNHVLLALPAGFDLGRRAAIVVFFHGNQAILERDVVLRQHVLDQLQESGLNAALIAPQFAVDALDSSAGRFWQPGAFARFMAEAARALADLCGARSARASFAGMPIFFVAYSGGYNPAVYAATVGGAERRIHGFVLLDALFGEEDRFTDWIEHHRDAFFFSAYTEASASENADVMGRLKKEGIRCRTGLPRALVPGEVTFLSTPGLDHSAYVTTAWVEEPLAWILRRIPGFQR